MILKDPPEAISDVKRFRVNPYTGLVFCVPSVLKPAVDLSCQYLRTPVTLSYETTLPTAVVPDPVVCVIKESAVKVAESAPDPVNLIA